MLQEDEKDLPKVPKDGFGCEAMATRDLMVRMRQEYLAYLGGFVFHWSTFSHLCSSLLDPATSPALLQHSSATLEGNTSPSLYTGRNLKTTQRSLVAADCS